MHFDDVRKQYEKVLEAGTLESFTTFLESLPLDEEQHILTAMDSVERFGDNLTDIEKLNILMASWLSKKVDKFLAQEKTDFSNLTIPQVQFIDYVRKREEKAMDRLDDARENQSTGRRLDEVLGEIEAIRNKALAKEMVKQNTSKIVLEPSDDTDNNDDDA